MDYEALQSLRERHPAWRLLRADNAALVLSFLERFFIAENRGATSAADIAEALEDHLFARNSDHPEPRFPKSPLSYLEDWAAPESGWLRRFYPPGSDEVHYEITPAFEKANAWVESLRARPFVGTESRLHTVVELLRQIVHGSEANPKVRLAELHRKREEIEAQIAAVEAGDLRLIDSTGIRDRYQQFSSTARELLADFREVEENFRGLDRAARERITAWEGGKGELLAELVDNRADISCSDQGRSFQAFYDFLLSESRQDELSTLLAKVAELEAVETAQPDRRLRSIHHEWSEAAERTQRTVRQISEQLRRFLDDQAWLENRRVLELVRQVESLALDVRSTPPSSGLQVDEPGVAINLPFERPLHSVRAPATVDSLLPPQADEELDTDPLFSQLFIDQSRLADNIRTVLPKRSSASLSDIVQLFPVEQGAAEIIGYLSLSDEDLEIEMDDTGEMLLEFSDEAGLTRRARLPQVTVIRR